jgi:biopolymer transport protein ExbD
MAPMIDIVFLLLIFFIVNIQFTKDEYDLEVAVPTSTEGNEDKARAISEIVINIRVDGSTVVNGKVLTEDELLSHLSNIARVHENQPVRMRGDGAISWETMVKVIDIVERAGIWNISFATQKPQREALNR